MRIILSILIILSLQAFAQENTQSCNDPWTDCIDYGLTSDNPIIYEMDVLMRMNFFDKNPLITDTSALNVYNFPADSVPVYSDEIMAQRLRAIDGNTPFKLSYNNNVKGFIYLYANRKRELTSRILGLSHVYFPMFEEMLDKYNLPLELKYLAVVESALNPTAKSRSGAMGLWQFMYPTGKIFGLEVTSYVDDRMDPYQATEAACKYFKQLYSIYGNWELVLAAYNCGPGTVNKALRRSGYKKDYWELWPYLPKETRGYVPAFIAVNYIMKYAAEHNLYPVHPKRTYFEYDTLHVSRELTFEQLSATLEIPYEQIQFLNPRYKNGVIPNNGKTHTLYLPHEKVGLFLYNEEAVYNSIVPGDSLVADSQEYIISETKKTHIVKKGQYIGAIADMYNVSVNDIKSWNSMHSSKVYPGQKLTILITEKKSASNVEEKTIAIEKPSSDKYIVQRGDTLWSIAAARGTTVDKLKASNGITDSHSLKAGMELTIPQN